MLTHPTLYVSGGSTENSTANMIYLHWSTPMVVVNGIDTAYNIGIMTYPRSSALTDISIGTNMADNTETMTDRR